MHGSLSQRCRFRWSRLSEAWASQFVSALQIIIISSQQLRTTGLTEGNQLERLLKMRVPVSGSTDSGSEKGSVKNKARNTYQSFGSIGKESPYTVLRTCRYSVDSKGDSLKHRRRSIARVLGNPLAIRRSSWISSSLLPTKTIRK